MRLAAIMAWRAHVRPLDKSVPPRHPLALGDGRRLTAIGVAVAIAYVIAAYLGLRLAFVAEQVTTVWAPTGIGIAALLLWGQVLWPALWLAPGSESWS